MNSSSSEPLAHTIDHPTNKEPSAELPAPPTPPHSKATGAAIPELVDVTLMPPTKSDAVASEAAALGGMLTIPQLSAPVPYPLPDIVSSGERAANKPVRHMPTTNPATRLSQTPIATPTGEPELPKVPDYEIMEELGRGGMGVVYKARQIKANRIVALKMVLSGKRLAVEQRIRFQIETEAVARLAHPHIVQLYAVGELEGQPFFSLEFCAGGNLDKKLNNQPLPAGEAAVLMEKLARAMYYAHSRGVVHRDLKPANILLTTDGEPKVTDFGLAKRLDTDSDVSRSGMVMGTASYMAPEQARGAVHEVGPATDVWALGAVLYECLTGRPPFRGATVFETMRILLSEELTRPSSVNDKVPRDLETICLKCLNKEPGRRYDSALELAEELRRYREGEPIRARPSSRWERTWKWVRREPARAAAVGAGVLALAAVVLGTIFFSLYREHQSATKAQTLERQREVRQKFDVQLGLAERAEEANRLGEAGDHFEQALAMLDGDPEAISAELRPRVVAGRGRVRGKAAAEKDRVESELAEKKRQQEIRDQRDAFARRVEEFKRARDKVLFHSVSLREENAANDAAVVRLTAPAALEKLKLDVTKKPEDFGQGLAPFRPILESSAPVDALAVDACTVLLAWAAAELSSTADPVDGDPNPSRALRLLEAAQALARAHEFKLPQIHYLRRATCYQQLGKEGDAAVERRNAAAAPRLSIDEIEVARGYLRGGDRRQLDKAEAACELVDAADPYRFWAQYLAALCNMLRKEPQWNVAESRLSNCLEKRPNDPTLLMHRAIAYAGAGNLPKAEADFQEALDRSTGPAMRVVVLTNRSFLLVKLERWPEAERDLTEAIARQPDSYQGHANLAFVYHQQKNKQAEALRAMDKALECRPDYAALYFVRAQMHMKGDDLKAARLDFEKCLELAPIDSPHRPKARLGLANVKTKTGELAAALADCDAVLQQKPNFGAAHFQRAEVLRRQNEFKEAGDALDRYLSASGDAGADIHKVHKLRGLIHTSQNRHGEATVAFTRSLLLHPEAETYSLRGWSFLTQGASRSALNDFDAALRLEQAHPDALCGRAWSLALLGKTFEAEAAAETVLKQEPASRALLFKLACVYSLALRHHGPEGIALCHERAVTLLQQAVKANPTEADVQAFWQNVVERAPEFSALRASIEWREMARLYGPKK